MPVGGYSTFRNDLGVEGNGLSTVVRLECYLLSPIVGHVANDMVGRRHCEQKAAGDVGYLPLHYEARQAVSTGLGGEHLNRHVYLAGILLALIGGHRYGSGRDVIFIYLIHSLFHNGDETVRVQFRLDVIGVIVHIVVEIHISSKRTELGVIPDCEVLSPQILSGHKGRELRTSIAVGTLHVFEAGTVGVIDISVLVVQVS